VHRGRDRRLLVRPSAKVCDRVGDFGLDALLVLLAFGLT